MNEAIQFGLYLSDNIYVEINGKILMNDGKTWVCMNDEGYEECDKREDHKRYTIEEIFTYEFKQLR